MVKTAREEFPIKVIDGVEYADPIGDERYLVKFYDLPPREDLPAYIRLIESFERRFFYTADRGMEALRHKDDIDQYVESSREAYEAAQGRAKELAGGKLCMALLERGITRAKQHIRLRIGGEQHDKPYVSTDKPDEAYLSTIEKGVASDLTEAANLFQHVRRKRGHMDIDGVLNEMKGEPYNIFVGTLPRASDYIHMFHQNRFRKAANAMVCIDRVADTIEEVTASHPQFKKANLSQLIREMAKYAKLRVQTDRSDPQFREIDDRLCEVRNELQAFTPVKENPPTHLPAGHAAGAMPSPTAVELIRDAVDVIYDMSIIRGERKASAANLKARVAEHMQAMGRSTQL